MNNASALSIAALALGGVAIGLSLFRAPATSSRSAPALPDAGAADSLPASRLLARLDGVEEAQRRLADRLAMLEVQVTSAPRTPAATSLVSRTDLEALREELRAALAGGPLPKGLSGDGSPTPEFTERVARSMQEIGVTEAREDARRSVAWRSERLRERLPEVAQTLGLTAQQEASLESSLVAQYERRANYGVLWASGEIEEKSEFRELDQANMSTFMADLGAFLTPQQLEDYLVLQGDLFPGGEGGGK